MTGPDGAAFEALFRRALSAHRGAVDAVERLWPRVREAGTRLEACLAEGGTVYWMGNGGSAADSQHLAAELVGRFTEDAPPLRSVAFTTDASVLTSVANDLGFEQVFARQARALCRPGDVAVALSTSGRSPNVVAGIEEAARQGAFTVGLTGGDGGELARRVDLALVVPAEGTARIQEAHLLIGHVWCAYLDGFRLGPNAGS